MTNFLKDKILIYFGLAFLPFYFLIAWVFNCIDHSLDLLTHIQRTVWFYWPATGALLAIYIIYFALHSNFFRIKDSHRTLKIVVIFSFIFVAIMFFAVPAPQEDFYHYFFEDVVLAKYHLNPFIITPNDLPAEPLSQLSFWQDLPTQHGPFRFFLTAPIAFLSHNSIVLGIFWYKILFSLFFFASGFLIYRILTILKAADRLFALTLFLWNPLIIYETLVGGGTDILMVFWLLLGIYFLAQNKFNSAIVSLTLSVLIKYVTVIFIPFFIAFIFFNQPNWWKKIIVLAGNIFLISATTVLLFWPFWDGWQVFTGISQVAGEFHINSFPAILSFPFFVTGLPVDLITIKYIFEFLFAVVYLILFFLFLKSPKTDLKNLIYYSSIALLSFLFLAKFWFYSKYLIWLLPLLLLNNRRLYPLAILLTGLIIFSPLKDLGVLFVFSLVPAILVFVFDKYLIKKHQLI